MYNVATNLRIINFNINLNDVSFFVEVSGLILSGYIQNIYFQEQLYSRKLNILLLVK